MLRIAFLFLILNFIFNYECSSQVDTTYVFFVPSKPELGRIVSKGSNCEDFKYNLSDKYYLNNAGRPYLTKEDSTQIILHAINTGEIKYAIKTKTVADIDTNINALMYLFPRIRNIYNSDLLNKTTIVAKEKEKVSDRLSNAQLHEIYNSDAAIIGEVIDKLYIKDTVNCYFYSGEYLVKVNEVLHSYFKLSVNDIVLIKSTHGFSGGCYSKHPEAISYSPHEAHFNIGDKGIFFLRHASYYSKFIRFIKNTYNDEYCPKAFDFYYDNRLYTKEDDLTINFMRNFVKQNK